VVNRAALQVPLRGKRLEATGDVLLRAEVVLLLVAVDGNWELTTFRVDSATDMPTMPAAQARMLGLPMPQEPTRGLVVSTAGGTSAEEVRAGVLRARFLGLEETEFILPCFFLGNPAAATEEAGGRLPRYLLGLTGVIDKVRLVFDGTPGPEAPYGYVVVEKQ
jgi:hypothetical protein